MVESLWLRVGWVVMRVSTSSSILSLPFPMRFREWLVRRL